jgi:hypothetical protein
VAEVAAFGGDEAFGQVGGVRVVGEERPESFFGQAEEGFVLPECVIGVESDGQTGCRQGLVSLWAFLVPRSGYIRRSWQV